MSGITRFVIRAYGIFIHPQKGVLVSDEKIKNKNITKFPGGGVEFGEGVTDALLRELLEETRCQFKILSHYYTTHFFVASAFDNYSQVISVYYVVEPEDEALLSISSKPFDFPGPFEKSQSFRFVHPVELKSSMFELEIDKYVCGLLISDSKLFTR